MRRLYDSRNPAWQILLAVAAWLLALTILGFAGASRAATTSAPVASSTAGQTVTADWTAPTTREDGSPLAPSAIDHYTVYYAVGSAPTKSSPSVKVTAGTTATIALTLAPSAQPQEVEAAVTTTDTNGLESALSNIGTKSFLVQSSSAPSAPTSVTFSVTCGSGCTITE